MTGGTLTLGQLVDMAVGMPEQGSVNFNLLHALLHAILDNLGLTDTTIQVDQSVINAARAQVRMSYFPFCFFPIKFLCIPC